MIQRFLPNIRDHITTLRTPPFVVTVCSPVTSVPLKLNGFTARIHSRSNLPMFRRGDQVAELLISAGADVRAKNGRGEMPMDLARNEIVLALLLSAAQELDKREEKEVRKWSSGTRLPLFRP